MLIVEQFGNSAKKKGKKKKGQAYLLGLLFSGQHARGFGASERKPGPSPCDLSGTARIASAIGSKVAVLFFSSFFFRYSHGGGNSE
jgi:hypothetical protein